MSDFVGGNVSSFGEFINIIKSFQSEDELLDFVNKRYQFLEENNKDLFLLDLDLLLPKDNI